MQGFLASLTPWLESVEARMTTEISGLRPLMSFGQFDRSGCFSKTCLELFPTDSSARSSVTWPPSGTMQGGRCWALTTWAPRTDASGGGALQWTTPCQDDTSTRTKRYAQGGTALSMQAATMWPTARGTDGSKGGPNQRGSKGDMMLPSAAVSHSSRPHLTTPQGGSECSGDGPGSRRQWSTPSTVDSKDKTNLTMEQWRERNQRKKAENPALGEIRLGLGTQARGNAGGKRLNPLFVEWLMGWPIGWTDSRRWATAKSRSVRRRRG